jgi:hypothetical protein
MLIKRSSPDVILVLGVSLAEPGAMRKRTERKSVSAHAGNAPLTRYSPPGRYPPIETAAGDHLLCGGGSVFLMTCFRAPFHEETELLSALRFPFRVRTPNGTFA